MSSRNTEDYAGAFYFIIPKRNTLLESDALGAFMLRELHEAKKIDCVFLDYHESYPLIEDDCKKHSIRISRLQSPLELRIAPLREKSLHHAKRMAYISRNTNQDIAEEIGEELSSMQFYVESRISY